MKSLKEILKETPLLFRIYNLKNGFWKKGLLVVTEKGNVRLDGIKVKQKGKNNRLYIGDGTHLCKCRIRIYGDNNIIRIGAKASLKGTTFFIENNDNEICVGAHTTTTDQVEISAIEGTKVSIGDDCMISSKVYMSTGDGHSVCDSSGRRTNISRDIVIGNHVWIGTRTIIGKGFKIGDDSILAAGGVGTASEEIPRNVVMAGNPARIVKTEIGWLRKRI